MARKRRRAAAKPAVSSFDLLWTRRQAPRRGTKPQFRLEHTIDAAVRIADAEGLGGLTMSRIAHELGVTTMALYRYVPGKEPLVDLMIDAVLKRPPRPSLRGWRVDAEAWAHADLARFLKHRWLFEATSTRASLGPNWVGWLEAAFAAFASTRLSAAEILAAMMLLDGHVRSSAQIMVGAKASREWARNFRQMLGVLGRGDARFPHLTAAVQSGRFDEPELTIGQEFEFGLQRLLNGIEQFVEEPRLTR